MGNRRQYERHIMRVVWYGGTRECACFDDVFKKNRICNKRYLSVIICSGYIVVLEVYFWTQKWYHKGGGGKGEIEFVEKTKCSCSTLVAIILVIRYPYQLLRIET